MRVWVGSSLATSPPDAILDVGNRLRALGAPLGHSCDASGVALCFVNARLAGEGKAMHDALGDLLLPRPYITWVGTSVFHDQRVPEKRPGLVVAIVDGVVGEVRHTLWDQFGMPMAAALLADSLTASARFLSISPASGPGGLDVLAALDEAGGDIVGALAHRRQHLKPGISTLSLQGTRLFTAVAQAARQLGPVRVVTAASQNLIQELDGRPAFEQLMHDLPGPLRDQLGRLGGSLFASFGVEDGDTSVLRSITAVDPRTGTVAVSEQARVGAEVAFSMRDQAAARADLEDALAALEGALEGRRPLLFTVFSSSARDAALLGAPLWDITRVLSRFGPDVPVVGITGAGELARLGGSTLVMGHTAVVAALVSA
jgi:small ligand-binding sensory domain FIST